MVAEQLSGPILKAKSGNATSAVVFLHGFGSDGADLISLGELLADIFPNTSFFAPNAPQPTAFGQGYQWFDDNQFTFVDRPGIGVAAELLEDYLEQVVLAEHHIALDHVVLVGFSQGTMTALFAAPRFRNTIAGLVAFSGVLMWQDELMSSAYQTFPVLVAHNEDDDVVNFRASEEIYEQLQELGFEDVELVLERRGGHSISEAGLKAMISFLQNIL